MSAPAAITTGRNIAVSRRLLYHQPSLSLTRMEGNEAVATPACIRKAWEHLEGLYCDYCIADSLRSTLRTKYERYQQEEKEVREREKELPERRTLPKGPGVFFPPTAKLIIIETEHDAPEASLDLLIRSTELFHTLCTVSGVNPESPANPGRIDKRKPMWVPFMAELKRQGPLSLWT